MQSGWEHEASFSQPSGSRLPSSNWPNTLGEAAADRMPSIFLSARTEPHPVPLPFQGGPNTVGHLLSIELGRDHHSGREHASPQSSVSSRCAVPPLSLICSRVALSASRDPRKLASLSQARKKKDLFGLFLTSSFWCLCQTAPPQHRREGDIWLGPVNTLWAACCWYVHKKKMAHVLARCGYYCCACPAVVREFL